MATTDTDVSQLVINKLTKQQYDAIATKVPTELYAVTDVPAVDVMTGATSGTAGTSGTVPAPAAGDDTKFLSGDGTWKTAGGGDTTAKVLTSADYNWNHTTQTTTNPDSVALWLLDPGIYSFSSPLEVYRDKNTQVNDLDAYIVGKNYAYGIPVIQIRYNMSGSSWTWGTLYSVSSITQSTTHTGNLGETIDNLTTDSSGAALSAKQGKALKDLIDSLVINGTGAPTTSTVGTVGKLYEDTTNGKLYICIAIDTTDPQNPVYTWSELVSGGGDTGWQDCTYASGYQVSTNAGFKKLQMRLYNGVLYFRGGASKTNGNISSEVVVADIPSSILTAWMAADNTGNVPVVVGRSGGYGFSYWSFNPSDGKIYVGCNNTAGWAGMNGSYAL